MTPSPMKFIEISTERDTRTDLRSVKILTNLIKASFMNYESFLVFPGVGLEDNVKQAPLMSQKNVA